MKRTFLWAAWLLTLSIPAPAQPGSTDVQVLAFGDVNLGRTVGQKILKGDTLFPFRFMADSLRKADLVFVNLESPITDQGGRTQHPKYNMIFCGPPAAAQALKEAGIDVVSTANNHAFDFGMRALRETIAYLDSAGIAWTGTSIDSVAAFEPSVVSVRGVRIGFVAFTEFVNLPGSGSGHISMFDSVSAEEAIRRVRERSDIVIASYHGGGEYGDEPSRRSLNHLRWLAACGADVVLGHHSHVPQGLELVGDSWIVRSLGNFVFFQPQLYWTQVGMAARISIRRDSDSVFVSGMELLPFRASLQPQWDLSSSAQDSLVARLARGSSLHYSRSQGIIHVSHITTP